MSRRKWSLLIGLIGSVVFNVNAIKWCYTSGAVNPDKYKIYGRGYAAC